MSSRRVVLGLALSSLRYRAAASLASFVAILIGCGLLIACAGLFETAIVLKAQPQRLAAAPVVVGGSAGFKLPDEESQVVPYAERAGLPEDGIAKISAVEGVGQAVPDVSFAAALLRDGAPAAGSGTSVLSGHGWDSAALGGYKIVEGAAPGATGQVVLDAATAGAAGIRPGTTVDLAVAGARQSFLVSGIARPAQEVQAPGFFFSAADAQRYNPHPGSVGLAGVFPADGVDADELAGRIAEQVPGLTVLTGDDRGAAEFLGVDAGQLPLILLAAVFGGMVLVVMALVVSATISLTVRQRQQELALLRATGATPKQVHRMVLFETMAVGVLAAVCGAVLGSLLGGRIFATSVSLGIVPHELAFTQDIIAFGAGIVATLAITYAAAWFAALAAARARPIQALAEASIPGAKVNPLRRMGAVVFAAATVLLAATTLFMPADTASAIGGPAVLTGAIAVALLGPEIMAWVADRFGPFIRRVAGRDATLAVINSRARAVAFAAVLTPVTLASAVALGNVYSETTAQKAQVAAYAGQLQADAVVSSEAGGISADEFARIRSTPGVGTASPLVTSSGWIEQPYDGNGSDPLRLLGVAGQDQGGTVLATEVTEGSLEQLRGNTVALPEDVADDLEIKVGDQITMRLGDGAQVPVKLVALLDSPSSYASMVLPADLLTAHTTSGLAPQVLVRAAEGTDADTLVSALSDRTANWPGSTVGDSDALAESFQASADVEALINYLLAVLAIAYAAIAAVNTLAVAVLARRREFGAQRLAGADRRQVRRMLFVEGGIVSVTGLVLGIVISLFTVLPMAITTGEIIPSGPIWVFLAVVLAIFLIVWPVTALSARLAMRRNPIDAVTLPGQ
ncbi:ABC transporter permease [Amycolatopsis jiangsuensis]|uniref:Putative ABC transport system permease protein n=1 Tax=Amycolatopsis jiangsuensis TaxID=1181879 RepID=A0A840J6K2_9PSEU|nr:FtsX-like permease family protein [Amycolatopsis jiangsuensis]MBB4689027.1 putative ABC transport system permease protein [Amycolatopsis jiangsuensis]